MKVENNHEEVFAKPKENETYYVNDDLRSQYNKWKNSPNYKNFVQSASIPKFYRTQSKGTYVKDRSSS